MKALLVISPSRFRDEEYFQTKAELEKVHIGTVTASKTTDVSIGMLGGKVAPGKTLNSVDAQAFDAVVFIGGGGSEIYFNDPAALEIARKADAAGKIVAAICIAPTILANAGVLKGKHVTAFPSEETNLRARGADFTGDAVTVDGRIITANGSAASKEFGKAIVKALGK